MTNEITHVDKIRWMLQWANNNEVTLDLEAKCGLGRDCVGIVLFGRYPEYTSGWTPPDAYHKHDCVAVLGRGEAAESQLYDWLKWFDDNNYIVEKGTGKNQGFSCMVQVKKHKAIPVQQKAPEWKCVSEAILYSNEEYCRETKLAKILKSPRVKIQWTSGDVIYGQVDGWGWGYWDKLESYCPLSVHEVERDIRQALEQRLPVFVREGDA